VRTSSAGSLLVVTLWLVAILSALAIAVARYLSIEVRVAKYHETREQTKALARGGVYLAIQRLRQDAQAEPYDWLGDDWAAAPKAPAEQPGRWVIFTDEAEASGDAASRSRVEIQITDLERSINLNAATKETLARPELTGSAEMAQAIIDDRDPPDESEPTVDDPPYYPKNGPFAALEELLDIPGDADVFPRLRQVIFAVLDAVPALPEVNINTAQRDVLVALGADPTTVERLLASRPGPDSLWGTEDDCKADDISRIIETFTNCAFGGDRRPVEELHLLNGRSAVFAVTSSMFRIHSEAFMGSPPVIHRIDAVVKRSAQGQDVTVDILSWRDA